MTPKRPERTHLGGGIAIAFAAFAIILIILALIVPLMNERESAVIQNMGTPIAALATAHARPAASPTTRPRTPSPTVRPNMGLPATTATPSPGVPDSITPTPVAATPAPSPSPVDTATGTATGDAVMSPTASSPLPTAVDTATDASPPVASTPVPPTPTVDESGKPNDTAIAGDTSLPAGPAATSGPSGTPTVAPEIASMVATATPAYLAELARQIIVLTNRERTDRGLSPLTADPLLDKIAADRSRDMIVRRYFSHYDPVTHQPAVVDLLNRMVIPYQEVGENILNNTNLPLDSSTPAQVVSAWMASKEHRDNILSPPYTNIGVGIAVAAQDGAFRAVFTQVFLD